MQLSGKIKFALDEARMLILGGQVLVGFGYQSVFQPGFPRLPASSQCLQLSSLTLLLMGLALAMAPAARDRVVERGKPTPAFYRFATRIIAWALMPFAIGLGIAVYVAVRIVADLRIASAAGALTFILALTLWYGSRIVVPRSPSGNEAPEESDMQLSEKITHALTEARMVLPGAQAMLGFQFIGMLTESFDNLPTSSKYFHVVSLGMTALTVILLITPAAYHRLVERGDATQRQHRVTTAFLLAAMVTLPPGITGDLFVVFRKVTGSVTVAIAISAMMLVLFYGLWFGPALLFRRSKRLT